MPSTTSKRRLLYQDRRRRGLCGRCGNFSPKASLCERCASYQSSKINKTRRSTRNKSYRQQHAAALKVSDAKNYLSRHRRLKQTVLMHYSAGSMCCALCPETRLGALAIDHIAGGGNQHRKTIGQSSHAFYKWLVENNLPSGFRVLCANCNIKVSPRAARSTTLAAARARRHQAKTKAKVIALLGGKCSECGKDDIDILTVHHVNNDGAAHRRSIPHGKSTMYRAILKSGNIKGLECLCFSCNVNDWIGNLQ